jgi:hypothetical protein
VTTQFQGISDLEKFFDEENNAIVKSFHNSTRGKGLAGFITSLNYDWLTNNTWTTDRFGSRAPKNLKITLNFAPIHDIPPGLDVDGFDRAPIYNVGKYVNSMGGDAYDDKGTSKQSYKKKLSDNG